MRLLAGGGPSTPDPAVLATLTTPLIGQFDPLFTQVMDDVVQLARQAFLTDRPNTFAISALASGGVEAVINSLVEPEKKTRVAVAGSPTFVARTAEIVGRCGGEPVPPGDAAALMIVPLVDPFSATLFPVVDMAAHVHTRGGRLIVDATLGVGACELRVDEWAIDVCVAGADYGVGAPPGMSLVTYSAEVDSAMRRRTSPPRTSYLDLLQLRAYWSPERLNHHTAPTSLVYGLREALRLVQIEGPAARWQRHLSACLALGRGIAPLAAVESIGGGPPVLSVQLRHSLDISRARQRLRDEFGVHVTQVGAHTWRVGLLGNDAREQNVNQVVAAFEKVLDQ